MFLQIVVLKNLANFTGVSVSFFKKLHALRSVALLKKDSNAGFFLRNLRKFYKHLVLQNISNGCF